MNTKTTLIFLGCLILISSCDRYRVTLNDKIISSPPKLFENFQMSSAALQNCIAQTIYDLEIRRPEELNTLVCSHAGISTLEGLEVFSKLKTLNLADNNLTSIEPLLFLGQLESINLLNNPSLNCSEIPSLAKQIPKQSTLLLPEHCSRLR